MTGATRLRETTSAHDRAAIEAITRSSGFFSEAEVAVALEVFDDSLTRPELRYYFILAETDGRVSGYTCYGPIDMTESSFDLYWIAVAGDVRARGIGKLLMEAAEAAAARQGCDRMYVETAGRAQYDPTRAFYERMGYRQGAVLEDFYAPGDAKVIYVKRLRPA